ncbi:cAMP-regulated phosphoprotein 21 isoform X1 [Salmo salar]|uniref:cAMP-regulated phosphoprotein 21 isoform X1 n=2 Tax=Salmo salar TaxID=8030 RepID=A0ABM3E3I9_SALSA|nr:cAMP-regulated phosphoprotein 21 isoform X1 [Salmo salar]
MHTPLDPTRQPWSVLNRGKEFSERMSEAIVPESSGLRSCNELCPSALPSSPPLATEDECHHDNRKVEQQKPVSNQGQPARKRTKAKGRLVRSMAVCEESLPPSSPDTTQDSQSSVEVTMLPGCHDNEEEEQSKEPNVPTLIISDTSQEYTDSTGIDLHQFIITTLNSNPRDRMMLLKLEQDMIDFITDNGPYKKFPHMSSYHRMLVHRVAAYFGMEHNVDQTGKSVIINSTSNTRIPEQRFMDYVQEERGEETQWRTILKRDNAEDNQARLHPLREERRSKSMEEREEEYQRARERIFNQEPACPQETRSIEDGSPHAATQRRQLFRGTRGNSGSSRQSSTETDYSRYSNWSSTDSGRYSNDPRPWSSTDSDSAYQRPNPTPKARPANHSWDARDDHAPTTGSNYLTVPMENGIPPGSILLNPHTGQPFLNPDGTPAIYNPPDPQQPTRSQPQQQAPLPQQPMAGHTVPQVVQYSSVSYPPQQLQYSPSEDLSSQFGHMTVSCQPLGETPSLYPPLASPTQSYVYTAPPPPHNPPSYCQPPPTQVPVYYYSTTQYPTSAPQRPATPTQAIQPTGYSPVVANQQQSYQGMMGLQLPQSQAQRLLGSYPPGSSHPCGVTQGGVGVSYPQTGLMSQGEGGYCCMVSPTCPPGPIPPLHTGCHASSCSNISSQGWAGKY